MLFTSAVSVFKLTVLKLGFEENNFNNFTAFVIIV